MSSINKAAQPVTHGNSPAKAITKEQELRRSVLACLLWEDTFYEDGVSIADRITKLSKEVSPDQVLQLATEARISMKLRHVPLLLLVALAERRIYSAELGRTVTEVCQRPDDMTELLAIYWKDCIGLEQQHKTKPLPNQFRIGLANAIRKFDEYQLAKYNRDGAVSLKDIVFLTRPKPTPAIQKLVDDTLPVPGTWENRLSAGENKKAVFEEMLRENKLGYMALLRNLRNMQQEGVDRALVDDALQRGAMNSKALPFRFVAAARACPQWEHMIDRAMQITMNNLEPLSGKTTIAVDISASMNASLSSKSQLNRKDAACALAVLVAGVSEDFEVIAFHNSIHKVPSRKGLGLIEAINNFGTGGTNLPAAVQEGNRTKPDRLIVITDEQSTHGRVPDPEGRGYMINVNSYQNGVGYGKWTNITGFSENVVTWIRELEKLDNSE